ncbi:MAG: amidohydrolase family protein, partial [Clostridia bacterium]|nr:amidohydrolase family protein [Clostridia bacterium]
NMSYEEIVAAVEVGKMHNRVVSCHAHGTAGILAAAKAGITSIEHCTMVDDECIDYMLKNNVAAVPTLIVLHVLADGLSKGVAKSAVDKAAFLLPKHSDNIGNAYRRGVRCVFGTDTGTPLGLHGYQHREFLYMVEAGITPEDTLLAATRYAAELLKWEDKVGTIEVGKMADIVAVDGNPLANMSVMTRDNIKLVVKDGTVYKNELK